MPGALLGGCFRILEVSFCQEVLSPHTGPTRRAAQIEADKETFTQLCLAKARTLHPLKSLLIILSSEFPI